MYCMDFGSASSSCDSDYAVPSNLFVAVGLYELAIVISRVEIDI